MVEDMTSDNEETLLTRLYAFDLDALSYVYDLYSEAIYRYGYRLLGSQDKAEECLSETFQRLLESLKKGKGPKKAVRPYLYRIAHNWITDQYRRSLSTEELPEDFPTNTEDPESATSKHFESQRLRKALIELPSTQRQAIVLKFIEGLDNKEIALALNKRVGAVKSLQNRGLKNLKTKLKVSL